MTLTLELAGRALEASLKHAATLDVTVCVVVRDAAAHLKALARMDGAWLGVTDVALRKASTSVLFEAETQAIWEVCKPGAQAHGLESSNGGAHHLRGRHSDSIARGRTLGRHLASRAVRSRRTMPSHEQESRR